MFISVTRIAVPRQHRAQMVAAFQRGAPDLKQFAGFLGFELWQNDEVLEAVSRWESRAAMEAYTRSPAYHAHHGPAAAAGGQEQGHGEPGAAGQPGGQIIQYEAEVVV